MSPHPPPQPCSVFEVRTSRTSAYARYDEKQEASVSNKTVDDIHESVLRPHLGFRVCTDLLQGYADAGLPIGRRPSPAQQCYREIKTTRAYVAHPIRVVLVASPCQDRPTRLIGAVACRRPDQSAQTRKQPAWTLSPDTIWPRMRQGSEGQLGRLVAVRDKYIAVYRRPAHILEWNLGHKH